MSRFTAPIAEQIWDMKYRFKDAQGSPIDQNVEDTWRRIARALVEPEVGNAPNTLAHLDFQDGVYDKFYEALEDFKYLPAGRIVAGAGTDRAVTLFNCLAAETRIPTAEYGAVPISDVAGEFVHVMDGNGTWQLSKINEFGEQACFSVHLKGGYNGREKRTVRATKEHRWIMENGPEKVTDTLVPGDVLKIVTRAEVAETADYLAGVAHGIAYGDGTRRYIHSDGTVSFCVRLCGEKIELFDYLEKAGWRHTQPPSFGEDILAVSGPTSIDLKSCPYEGVGVEYLTGFLHGWMATDGCVDSRDGRALISCGAYEADWLERYGPIAGMEVAYKTKLGDSTNYGERNIAIFNVAFKAWTLTPGDFLRSKHRENFGSTRKYPWIVESVDPSDDLEPVFCPRVLTTDSVQLMDGIHTGQCYVMGTIPDSMSGIFAMLREAALTMQQGGGIGYDFSPIRPKTSLVKKLGADASGPLSFMDCWDAMCRTVMSAGSRRGAMMATMRCDHPDIMDFITAKKDPARLRMFNLSVLVTDAFMAAVKANSSWDLVHIEPPKKGGTAAPILDHNGFSDRDGIGLPRYIHQTVRARDLWDAIMQNTYDQAEPGVIFIDRINKANNLNYCETISATNPCVSGDTPILTKTGYARIDALLGESVEVWNGESWSSVTPRITGRNQPMVRVELSDGSELRCTEGHRFYLASGECVSALELIDGDHLLKSEWPITDPDFADQPGLDYYGQGFYSGDGWMKAETQGQYIGLYGAKKDIPHEWNEVSRKTYDIAGGFEGTDTTETKDYLYFGKGWFNAKTFVPEGHSIEARRAWLAGLVDSDGYVTKDSCIQITSKDRGFLKRVKMLLNTMGATGQLSPMKDCFRLSISGSDANALELPLLRFTVQPVGVSKSRFVKVLSVEHEGHEETVYCFTEPKRGMGVFSGVLTGQCGEQPLPPYGACLLGSINLARLVENPFTDHAGIDNKELRKLVGTAVRMMDNVVDVSNFPLEAQEREAKAKRRIGLGVTGLADALIMCKLTYGSPEAVKRTEQWMKLIDHEAYAASVELAQEKGAFPLFDADKFLAPGTHASTLNRGLQEEIREHGIRNALLTSIAPTGTISLYAGNVSSGIEPVFAYSYTRKVLQKDGSKTEEVVEDYAVTKYREFWKQHEWENVLEDEFDPNEHLPDYFVSAQTLDPMAHVRMQAAAQAHVDSSISKTINCPEDISFEDFKEVYMAAWDSGCKGCTTYRPNDVTGSVLSVEPKKETPELETVEESTAKAMREDFRESYPETAAMWELPARPEELEGSTYKIKVGDQKAVYLTINDTVELDGTVRPFEIFLRSSDPSHDEWMVTVARLVSAIMRRPHDSSFVGPELMRVTSALTGGFQKGYGYQHSLVAAIGRKIKEHTERCSFMVQSDMKRPLEMPEFEDAELGLELDVMKFMNKSCPSCHSYNTKLESGCLTCLDCGHSKCG